MPFHCKLITITTIHSPQALIFLALINRTASLTSTTVIGGEVNIITALENGRKCSDYNIKSNNGKILMGEAYREFICPDRKYNIAFTSCNEIRKTFIHGKQYAKRKVHLH